VLLEDPESNQVHIRLRRDWERIAPDDEVLPELESDLEEKAREMGAAVFFTWVEETLSANLRTTDRQSVAVDNFERSLNRLYTKHVQTAASANTHIRLFSLRVAAGKFLENDEVESEGWVEAPPGLRRVTPDLFAAEIVGTSMEPYIPNGSICLFREFGAGSRQGKRVLVKEMGRGDSEAYTVKVYRSHKATSEDGEWRHGTIDLEPLNPEHEVLHLDPDENRYAVIAEFVQVLY